MEIWIVAGIAVIVAAAIGVVIVMTMRSRSQARETERLKGKFGTEYESAANELGKKEAESELAHREERVAALELRPIDAEQAAGFRELWTATQARFVDDPGSSIGEADRLIGEVMRARGYPVSDFEQRAADLSVTHSGVVENYRAAHGVAVSHSSNGASTENLRQAMVQYRWLFDSLVEEDGPPAQPTAPPEESMASAR